jgi:hypothetical protein
LTIFIVAHFSSSSSFCSDESIAEKVLSVGGLQRLVEYVGEMRDEKHIICIVIPFSFPLWVSFVGFSRDDANC